MLPVVKYFLLLYQVCQRFGLQFSQVMVISLMQLVLLKGLICIFTVVICSDKHSYNKHSSHAGFITQGTFLTHSTMTAERGPGFIQCGSCMKHFQKHGTIIPETLADRSIPCDRLAALLLSNGKLLTLDVRSLLSRYIPSIQSQSILIF